MVIIETRSPWQSPFSKAYYLENGTIRSPILASAQDVIEKLAKSYTYCNNKGE